MLSNKRNYFFLILITLTVFTRFFKLNWSSNFSFHPDENNMVSSILQMDINHLNPKFFAYGQFPLYLTFFTTPKHDFPTITLTLRFWSAVFASLSIIVFYFIGQKIFSSSKNTFFFCLLLIFTPGLIQSAHFGTTESILIFVFAVNILLSFLIYDKPNKNIYFLLSGIISGIGLSTKISAIILITPIFFSLFFLFLKKYSLKKVLIKLIFFVFISLIFGLLLSPYNLIDSQNFISSIKYEIGVANGSIPVFYTRQFIGSLPYIFQLKNIFPYVNGIFIFTFGTVGLFLIIHQFFQRHKLNKYLLITLSSSLIYFVYQGQLFVKWTRFMSPIFFIFPLLSILFFQKIKNKILNYFFIILAIVPGIYFLKTYFYQDIRIQATEWINQNIPEKSLVLSESGNVVNIPLFGSTIDVNNFDFYILGDSNHLEKLNQLINQSDYIFVPSRRVFANQNSSGFHYSQDYYKNLFSGKFDFYPIKFFSNSNSLFLNSENAEETWSVFDNPTIRIYQRNHEENISI